MSTSIATTCKIVDYVVKIHLLEDSQIRLNKYKDFSMPGYAGEAA